MWSQLPLCIAIMLMMLIVVQVQCQTCTEHVRWANMVHSCCMRQLSPRCHQCLMALCLWTSSADDCASMWLVWTHRASARCKTKHCPVTQRKKQDSYSRSTCLTPRWQCKKCWTSVGLVCSTLYDLSAVKLLPMNHRCEMAHKKCNFLNSNILHLHRAVRQFKKWFASVIAAKGSHVCAFSRFNPHQHAVQKFNSKFVACFHSLHISDLTYKNQCSVPLHFTAIIEAFPKLSYCLIYEKRTCFLCATVSFKSL